MKLDDAHPSWWDRDAQVLVREAQVLELLLDGASNVEIAKQTGMKLRTVKAHMSRMFRRHGIQGGIKRVKLAAKITAERAKKKAASAR